MKTYLKVSGKPDVTDLRISVTYRKERGRAYWLTVAPVEVEHKTMGGVGYKIETVAAYSGFTMMLEEVSRASRKAEERTEGEVEQALRDRTGRVWGVVEAVLEKHGLALQEEVTA